jgi:hypothetical protein
VKLLCLATTPTNIHPHLRRLDYLLDYFV